MCELKIARCRAKSYEKKSKFFEFFDQQTYIFFFSRQHTFKKLKLYTIRIDIFTYNTTQKAADDIKTSNGFN